MQFHYEFALGTLHFWGIAGIFARFCTRSLFFSSSTSICCPRWKMAAPSTASRQVLSGVLAAAVISAHGCAYAGLSMCSAAVAEASSVFDPNCTPIPGPFARGFSCKMRFAGTETGLHPGLTPGSPANDRLSYEDHRTHYTFPRGWCCAQRIRIGRLPGASAP